MRFPQTKWLEMLGLVPAIADDLMLFDNTTHGRGHRLVAHFHAGELMKLARAVPKWAQRVFGKEFEKWLGSRERGSSRAR